MSILKAYTLLLLVILVSFAAIPDGQHEISIRVYDSPEDGTLLLIKDIGTIDFIDGSPSSDPFQEIRLHNFGRDIVYTDMIIDGESFEGPRQAITMTSSLHREMEPMDAMEMGVQIGEPGNDVAIRSDRLVVGAGDPNEKITVEGAVSLQEIDIPPSASTGFGKLFIDNSNDHLYYMDESGTITDLTVDANAVQSVSSSANTTGRMDHMRFIPGEATEITESATDDTIYIRYDVSADGSGPCTSAPSLSAAIDGPSLVCSGEPGTSYSIPPATGATYYRWTLPSGSHIISGSGTNAIHVILGGTDGNVSVVALNDCGESAPRTKAVSINRPTTPGSISGDALVCQGATGISYSIVTVPDATDYSWTLPPGASISTGAGTPTVSVNFGTLGGDVCVRTVNSCGVSDPECLPVTTTTIPDIPGTITGSANVCSGETSVSYSVDAVAEASSYNWTVPTGASISAGTGTRSISVDFGSASGNISVTASSICGTSSARTMAVTVTSPPSAPGSIAGSGVVPPGTDDEAYSISAVTGATSYSWNVTGDAVIDGSATGTSINIDFGTSAATTVDICVSASNSCGTSSETCRTVTIAAPSGSQTFTYTGSEQSWTVPAGVFSVDITCRGASGGRGYINGSAGSGMGAQGGYADGTLAVTPGEVLYVYVGGQGGSSAAIGTGGFNGGGTADDTDSDNDDSGGGGGGASDVRQGGNAFADRVIVAGGGGGGGCSSGNGGAGGGTSGSSGSGSSPGAPGTQTSGYSLGNGMPGYQAGGGVSGGAGGGYWGGRTGTSSYSVGGSGGSGYIGGVTGGSTSNGGRTGNGEVIISW